MKTTEPNLQLDTNEEGGRRGEGWEKSKVGRWTCGGNERPPAAGDDEAEGSHGDMDSDSDCGLLPWTLTLTLQHSIVVSACVLYPSMLVSPFLVLRSAPALCRLKLETLAAPSAVILLRVLPAPIAPPTSLGIVFMFMFMFVSLTVAPLRSVLLSLCSALRILCSSSLCIPRCTNNE